MGNRSAFSAPERLTPRARLHPTIVRGEHFAFVVPAKTVAVAKTVAENFTRGLFVRRVETPHAGGVGEFATLVVTGSVPGSLPSVREPLLT